MDTDNKKPFKVSSNKFGKRNKELSNVSLVLFECYFSLLNMFKCLYAEFFISQKY